MAEKKTFSTKTDDGSLQYGAGIYFYNGHEFPIDEWDMEVTFTKKAPQFAPGTRVRSKYVNAYVLTVLAQYKDQVVAVDPNDDDIEIFDADDLVIV